MLSIYDDVVGGRSDRWSAALSESPALVATSCKMATMIFDGCDSDGDIDRHTIIR
jgi:hypothetical protein